MPHHRMAWAILIVVTCLPATLGAQVALPGCASPAPLESPTRSTPTQPGVCVVEGLPPAEVIPADYGFVAPGFDEFMTDGSFVVSPDRSKRVTCRHSEEDSEWRFFLTNEAEPDEAALLFSSAAFQPGLSFRVVWDGRSERLYVTVQPAGGPASAATIYRLDLAGSLTPVRPGDFEGWRIIAAQADSNQVVGLAGEPGAGTRLALLGPAGNVVLELPDAVVWEDSRDKRFLYSTGNSGWTDGPNEVWAGDRSGSFNVIGEGWCPRFVPGRDTVSYLASLDGVPLLVETDGVYQTALARLPELACVSGCWWVDGDHLALAGQAAPGAPGEGGTVVLEVTPSELAAPQIAGFDAPSPNLEPHPLSEEDDLWREIENAVRGLEPVLRPGYLPPGLSEVRIRRLEPNALSVDYLGDGRRLVIDTGPSSRPMYGREGEGISAMVRGQTAGGQRNPVGAPGEIDLWFEWEEPGRWVADLTHSADTVRYCVLAGGFTLDEALRFANGLAPVTGDPGPE